MASLKQLLDDYNLTWKTGLRFPPNPQDIFDLTRGNIREFLALVRSAFDGELVNIYERTRVNPSWDKDEPGPFRYANTLVEPDLSQIILVSEVNDREERIGIDTMGAVKFAFLRTSRENYSPVPSGVYISTSHGSTDSKILNPWYGRDEIVIATSIQSPKLRLL